MANLEKTTIIYLDHHTAGKNLVSFVGKRDGWLVRIQLAGGQANMALIIALAGAKYIQSAKGCWVKANPLPIFTCEELVVPVMKNTDFATFRAYK